MGEPLIHVRAVAAADFAAIGGVITRAFADMAARGQAGGEAALVDALRADHDLCVERVAQVDGAIVGHVAFSRVTAPTPTRMAALAPLAVDPAWHRRGIGAALVSAGLAALDVDLVLVLGDPAYYQRFGFAADVAARWVETPWDGPHMMALALHPPASNVPLRVRYPRAFGAR